MLRPDDHDRVKGTMSVASKRSPRSLAVVVLAAGHGKRMKSATPKVLHEVCGRPSLWHVLRAAVEGGRPHSVFVVVRKRGERVEQAVASWNIRPEPAFVEQRNPLGTGHAVLAAEEATAGADDVLVLPGDDPLVDAEHVRRLLQIHRRTRAAASILTTVVDDPRGYGRVIRKNDELVAIVQEDDASPAIRRIHEISTLVYAFRREELYRALPLVGRENRLGEHYLPDVLPILRDKGEKVAAIPTDLGGSLGFNSRQSMAKVARIMRGRILDKHLRSGVTLVDPQTTYVDVAVRIGRDSVIQPFTVLRGDTRIGHGCRIGPSVLIEDSRVEAEAEVTFAVVRGSRIGRRASVGPFASIRPGTSLGEGAKAGTFVELKASRVGRGSKVPHLSYVGDAVVGEGANIGAGTVTVNYDGYDKHRTVIGDGAFIGSDTMLVAPVKVGREGSTGAGSVITRDVPAGALAVERSEQRIVAGYRKRKRAAREEGRQGSGKAQAEGRP
jgi:bifunctional UDP-N-acetylglucosamine pyrophosphorylase / glucosamine-1-phosphate N-acetyltransferase